MLTNQIHFYMHYHIHVHKCTHIYDAQSIIRFPVVLKQNKIHSYPMTFYNLRKYELSGSWTDLNIHAWIYLYPYTHVLNNVHMSIDFIHDYFVQFSWLWQLYCFTKVLTKILGSRNDVLNGKSTKFQNQKQYFRAFIFHLKCTFLSKILVHLRYICTWHLNWFTYCMSKWVWYCCALLMLRLQFWKEISSRLSHSQLMTVLDLPLWCILWTFIQDIFGPYNQ